MTTMTITMDGVNYRLRVAYPTLEESFRIPDGPNAGDMLSGRHERDLGGTYYDHSMTVEPDPRYPADFDSFYLAISAPVATHTIKMPHGQGFITYAAEVSGGSVKYKGVMAGKKRWANLSVQFTANAPQRIPT